MGTVHVRGLVRATCNRRSTCKPNFSFWMATTTTTHSLLLPFGWCVFHTCRYVVDASDGDEPHLTVHACCWTPHMKHVDGLSMVLPRSPTVHYPHRAPSFGAMLSLCTVRGTGAHALAHPLGSQGEAGARDITSPKKHNTTINMNMTQHHIAYFSSRCVRRRSPSSGPCTASWSMRAARRARAAAACLTTGRSEYSGGGAARAGRGAGRSEVVCMMGRRGGGPAARTLEEARMHARMGGGGERPYAIAWETDARTATTQHATLMRQSMRDQV